MFVFSSTLQQSFLLSILVGIFCFLVSRLFFIFRHSLYIYSIFYIIMNIQARKLELIEQFLPVNDEGLIVKIESFLKNERVAAYADIKIG